MRVVVVSDSAGRAASFAAGLQREFASHGVSSKTCACDIRRVLELGASDEAGVSVVVLLPEVAHALAEVEGATDARVWAVPDADARRRNVKKIANDVLSLAGE